MQKVSKQSLAMLALSILLAISIALTFTFAAVSQARTATGTINFAGSSAILINDAQSDYTYTINIDGNGAVSASDSWQDVTVKLSASSTTSTFDAELSFVIGDGVAEDTEGLATILGNYITLDETSLGDTQYVAGEGFTLGDVVKIKTIDPTANAADLAKLASTSTTMKVKVVFTATTIR